MPSVAALLEIATSAAVAPASMLQSRGKATIAGAGANSRDIKLAEDQLSENIIVRHLSEHSALPILSEEAGWINRRPDVGERYWAVDPLDGSFNYFRGIPLCCTAVALCTGMTPLLGAVYDFNRDELFAGAEGHGLSINGTPQDGLHGCRDILATGFPVRGAHGAEAAAGMAEGIEGWRKIRMFGSAALSLAWLAAGRLDGYDERGIMWWDVAAGIALSCAAGHRAKIEGTSPDAPCNVQIGPR